MDNKEVIRVALKSLFEDYRGSDSEFIKYFSPDFKQWANGERSDLKGLLSHFAALQAKVPERRIDFVDMVAEGDLVFDQHVVTVLREGQPQEHVDVFVKWTVVDGLITDCQELTRHRSLAEGVPG